MFRNMTWYLYEMLQKQQFNVAWKETIFWKSDFINQVCVMYNHKSTSSKVRIATTAKINNSRCKKESTLSKKNRDILIFWNLNI